MSDDDIALSEKRMYGAKRPETHAYVASGLGVTRVETAGGQIGRFSLSERCNARDVAGASGEVAVATDEDVLVLTDDGFVPTGFGPATAVGYDGDGLLAAGDGRVARYSGEWRDIGEVADVRAIDGDRLAAAEGVYALPSLDRLGLVDVVDVAGDYAATESGLYRYESGSTDSDGEWTEVRSGRHLAVASDGEQVHAAAADGLYELTAGAWEPCTLPATERVVDVTYGDDTYAITENGTFLVATAAEATADGQGGWRQRSLGVPDVVGVAVA
ncbi:hypothetical protein HISP_15505 [Haloarcula hispanica N601]|uniref:HVO-0234-like beta-propeller domain-containing protein n=3 Tax=Haloarcula hispanica TaxID=51589 RepID=V5TQG1_HALHI|nr:MULTISPECIES: hypothetical protein [Haloarcula]AEM58621.1 conserved hypothetical protein [Haloarcula hispanica ATCC 33960]AHB67343.1 hypothetical protein HISP_15505 [Haloarcula hispanica N601]KZX46877.1 hypothetical protein AV929_00680 [Haloarcula sp. K1]MCJ0620335.1 hypothetical protein [Haloarcula hispanica]RYJ10746.1 hypothetical protein ELS20_12620 [Haloarcula hispanica]